jgi:hypothetical protein
MKTWPFGHIPAVLSSSSQHQAFTPANKALGLVIKHHEGVHIRSIVLIYDVIGSQISHAGLIPCELYKWLRRNKDYNLTLSYHTLITPPLYPVPRTDLP